MDTKQLQESFQSKKFRSIIVTIGIVVSALLIFFAGIEVGYMKASFSYGFGESYYRSFGPDSNHRGFGMLPSDISGAHGVSGKIISITLPRMVLADNDNTEKTVLIDDDTVVRELRGTITPADLKVSDYVIVIGSPDASAEIEAKFIRVLPPPPATTTPGVTTN